MNTTRKFLFPALIALAILALPALIPSVSAQDANPCGDSVTVVVGDTLIDIAERCNTTVEAIQAANPGLVPTALRVGQVIAMPSEDTPEPQPIVAVAPVTDDGGTVRFIANGLPAATDVVIGFGPPGSEYEVVEEALTTEEGALGRTVTVPDTLSGEEWLLVVETADFTAQAISTPGEPTLAIQPLSGPPGLNIEAVADGFPPNTQVQIGVGPPASEYRVIENAVTSDTGTLQLQLPIPNESQLGEELVYVVETLDFETSAISRTVQVTSGQAEPPAQSPCGDSVVIRSDDTLSEIAVRCETTVEALQEANPTVDPRALIPGTRLVIPGAGVSPQPTPPADDQALFERTNIYLIAQGDAGENGIPIGCDDSAVPVEVTFAPTIAPLTAALEELFAIDEQYYGQSGLYNALYDSNLTVEGIDIDGEQAIINLSGTINAGGVCSGPRIQAQIEQTALQYSTINSVMVMVDGQPLEDILSLR